MARILVIDDEPVLRFTFRHILEEEGYEVFDAEDGIEGIEVARESRPDLVITDMMMPRQQGCETVAILNREFPAMPVIAMSGADVSAPRDWQTNGKRVEYLAKPVDRPMLLALISKLLVR